MRIGRSKHWRGFRAVLCPVDFSERSRLALRYPDAIARRANARLTVPSVNDPLLIAAATAALHDRHFVERSPLSYHVLSHAATPVLACPPQWRPR
jgi:hypothetical protein